MVSYITKTEILQRFKYPYFGITLYNSKEIFIRNDLPKCVQKSVLAHEEDHLRRGYQGSFWKDELPSWGAGFKGSPTGFFLAIIMSLTIERLGLYFKRIKNNF